MNSSVLDNYEDEEIDDICCTPEEIRAIAQEAINYSGLPEQSRKLYENVYHDFEKWKKSKNIPQLSFSETSVIAYFKNLSEKYAPPTLWSRYSMLRATLDHFNDIKISDYARLKKFIKRKNVGYVKKKAKVFTAEQISQFLDDAPDEIYLDQKVVMIFGIDGALRSGDELTNVRIQHIENQGSLILVQVPKTKNKNPRSFVIHEDHARLVRKYSAMRPALVTTDRFFLNYQKGRCTTQVIGKNKFAKMPRLAAEYLELPNPELYTGHSYRRTSATLLANAKVDVLAIKKLGGWKSSTVEEYVDNTLEQQINTSKAIASTLKKASHQSSLDEEDKNNDIFAPLNALKKSFHHTNSSLSKQNIIVTNSATGTLTSMNSENQQLTTSQVCVDIDGNIDEYIVEEFSPPSASGRLHNNQKNGNVFNFRDCTVTIINKSD